jgi:hypothetical protein
MVVGSARVASVAGHPIDVASLEARVAELRHGPRGRHLPPEGAFETTRVHRWVVQELVTEAVLAHEARAAGMIASETGSGNRRRSAPGTGLSPSVLASLVERVTATVVVSPREVRAYYERNRDLYHRRESRRVRHILLASEASARRVARRLVAGDDMGTLAEALSTDAGTRARGGDLGDVHRGELTGRFEDALFGAEIGAIIGPIRTEHGWHVARVEAAASDVYRPFAEVRPAIRAELLAAARTQVFAAWLERRVSALAVIEPEFEHPAHPIHGVPSHRH